MKKLIVLLGCICISFIAFSQEYYWKDMPINIGDNKVMKNSKFTLDEFGRIYFIADNGIIHYIELKKDEQSSCHWIYEENNNNIPAREGSDLFYEKDYIYYVGINNEVCCYYYDWSNQKWRNKVLNSYFRNVLEGTTFTKGDDNRLYYVGDNGYIYYIKRIGADFSSKRLSGSYGIKARKNSNIIYHNNHIFYVGENDEICNYWWNNSSSGFWYINDEFKNVAQNTQITKDKYGRIFWITEDDKNIQCIDWVWGNNPGWISYGVMPELKADGDNGFIYNNDKFYYTYNDKVGCIFDDGNEYKHQILNNISKVKNYTFFNISNNGDLIYCSSIDDKIHLLKPKIYWEEKVIDTTKWLSEDNLIKNNIIKKYYKPKDKQLYPRDKNNKGKVELKGYVFGFNNITIRKNKKQYVMLNNNSRYNNPNDTYIISETSTNYISPINNDSAKFSVDISINAELSEYEFAYKLTNQTYFTNIASEIVCGDIYVISGQSNAESIDIDSLSIDSLNKICGQNTFYGRFSRTYKRNFYNNSENTNNWTRPSIRNENSWDSNSGILGTYLPYLIQKNYGIPVCILNDAVGGSSILQHITISSNDTINFSFNDVIDSVCFFLNKAPYGMVNADNPSHWQGHLNTWIRDTNAESFLKGFIWWQGSGDIKDNYDSLFYKKNFSQIHQSLNVVTKSNFNTYLVQIHSRPIKPNNNFEYAKRMISEEQRTMQDVIPNSIVRVLAANGLDKEGANCDVHYSLKGYKNATENIFHLLEQDFYGKKYDVSDFPLNISEAILIDNKLTINFNQEISVENSDEINKVLKAIKLSNESNKISPQINGNTFSFMVVDTTNLNYISYLGVIMNEDIRYPCHLRNKNNIGTLSFTNYPIDKKKKKNFCVDNFLDSKNQDNKLINLNEKRITIYPNPTNLNFYIKIPYKHIKYIEIYNINGIMINSFKLNKNMQLFNTNIKEKGIYNIKIIIHNKVFWKKVIIE